MPDFVIAYVIPYFNFLVFAAIVFFFAKKPIQQMFQDRSDQYKKQAEEIKKLYDVASQENNQLTARLAGLSQEIAELKSTNQKMIQNFIQKNSEETQKTIEQIQLDVQRSLQSELSQKSAWIKEQIVEMAKEKITEKVRKEMTAESKLGFLKQSIKTLGGLDLGLANGGTPSVNGHIANANKDKSSKQDLRK